MKKLKQIVTVILTCVLLIGTSYAQDKNTLELIKLFHANEINDISNQIFNKTSPTLKEKKTKEEALGQLHKELSVVYNNKFTEPEIKELIKLYNSELGKKLQSYNPNIINDAEAVIFNWKLSHMTSVSEEVSDSDIDPVLSDVNVNANNRVFKGKNKKLAANTAGTLNNFETDDLGIPIITDDIIVSDEIPKIPDNKD